MRTCGVAYHDITCSTVVWGEELGVPRLVGGDFVVIPRSPDCGQLRVRTRLALLAAGHRGEFHGPGGLGGQAQRVWCAVFGERLRFAKLVDLVGQALDQLAAHQRGDALHDVGQVLFVLGAVAERAVGVFCRRGFAHAPLLAHPIHQLAGRDGDFAALDCVALEHQDVGIGQFLACDVNGVRHKHAPNFLTSAALNHASALAVQVQQLGDGHLARVAVAQLLADHNKALFEVRLSGAYHLGLWPSQRGSAG